MKHYGRFLPDSRGLRNTVNDLEILYIRKATLEQKLLELNECIEREESDFSAYIVKEWTPEEIREAKEKAQQQIKS
ncbi:hypothetical protein J2810_004577 [Chryseobacterium rhizosphaerae]|uniref:hypothetical protein n=1 Tax=Chryseobacterium rhizosphaerae TaxID=395937 RepID=UPI002857621C|nr:hypothetical protein [Chryseobacterium rhizosphaerae]MDR6548487.1 hypothetical protein [Chryseobacterium rhizosphaerae]